VKKKTPTLEDKGGFPHTKASNAKYSSKADPLQSRKAESPDAMTKGKKPTSEVTKHLETQPRNAKKESSKSIQAPMGHDEEMYPEDFNRFNDRMTPTKHTKPGL